MTNENEYSSDLNFYTQAYISVKKTQPSFTQPSFWKVQHLRYLIDNWVFPNVLN